jgi:hypothetical protein
MNCAASEKTVAPAKRIVHLWPDSHSDRKLKTIAFDLEKHKP